MLKPLLGKFFRKSRDQAEEFVSDFDSLMKFLKWTFALPFIFGFGLGMSYSKFPLLGFSQSDNNKIGSGGSNNSEICADISHLKSFQSEYSAQIAPIMARWLEITKEIERPDLLPSEYERKNTAQSLLHDEIVRIQNQQSKDFNMLAEACNSKK